MPNIFISPTYTQPDKADGGIRRVSEALHKHLPEFGWTPVKEPKDADLINSHALDLIEGYEHIPVVQSSHGLMWHEYFGHTFDFANAQCVRALKRADAITAPSRWVAQAIQYGIACEPRVIPHGVDIEDWQPQTHQGYVLWNKARQDVVSDAGAVMQLAKLMPKTKFVSTLGQAAANLKITGVVPFAQMKRSIQQAGVYLALPRETFGIGTLEALACGVPIAGWDYGGQHDIVVQGETGYLAPYGDWHALAACVDLCFAERARLSPNARQDAVLRWQWLDKIGLYAALFKDVLQKAAPPITVSIIVTSYNLARYLPDALRSVQAQTGHVAWECIIVDDCSSDETARRAAEWQAKDDRFYYVKPDKNLGLPAARNFGISRASGKYVLPLDADDTLTPDALALLVSGMEADKSAHIGYGQLLIGNHDLSETRPSGWETLPYNWRAQVNHRVQLHYSAIMRRSIFERTQGYRRRSWQAEDAEFWCYATSYGFNAKRLTDAPTLIYRIRGDSKTAQNKSLGTAWSDGAWQAFYPFAGRAADAPFGAQGQALSESATTPCSFWQVPHHQTPLVSIIVPVGAAHRELVQDALDSVLAQTFTNWEAVIVNDSGSPLDLRGYGFVTQVNTVGQQGTGHARNLGVSHARAPRLVFLDADDFLQPTFLQDTLQVYDSREKKQCLIYTDWYQENGDGIESIWRCDEFSCQRILQSMIYNITVLHRKADFEAVQGFDESLYGWEDWDYFIKLMLWGVDGIHLAKPLMTYRKQTGVRRENAYANKADLLPKIRERYQKFMGDKMPCGCESDKVTPPPSVKTQAAADDMILAEYIGKQANTFRIEGKKTGTAYRFGNSDHHRQKYVFRADVKFNPDGTGHILGQPNEYRIITRPLVANGEGLSPLVIRDRIQEKQHA